MSASATLGETVADALRGALRSGELRAGERLVVLALAQRYGVSQAAVHDALHRLEREGWVSSESRRGVRVRAFTPDTAHEVFALAAEVGGLALGWAARDHTRVALLEALRPPLEQARRAHESGAWDARRAALVAFHGEVARLAGRPQTSEVLGVLHNQMTLLLADFERHGSPDAHRDGQIAGYEHLYGVLKFGSTDEAQAALRERLHADGTPVVRWLAGRG